MSDLLEVTVEDLLAVYPEEYKDFIETRSTLMHEIKNRYFTEDERFLIENYPDNLAKESWYFFQDGLRVNLSPCRLNLPMYDRNDRYPTPESAIDRDYDVSYMASRKLPDDSVEILNALSAKLKQYAKLFEDFFKTN